MNEFEGKRLLILGGAPFHLKLVRAARELGVYTIVTDYLDVEDAPAKLIADKSFQIDIKDIDGVAKLCKAERVDGVLGPWLDPCQEPYFEICHRLGLPCYMDNREQLTCLTDKETFKACCRQYGVDVIPGYEVEELYAPDADKHVQLPLMVKPARNRGSRGCTICHTLDEAKAAVEKAKKLSANGRAIIEKYIQSDKSYCVSFVVVHGVLHIATIVDCYYAPESFGIGKIPVAGSMPSVLLNNASFKKNFRNFADMVRGLGIHDAPVYMEGFLDGDTLRFYDPGFRRPGSNMDLAVLHTTGADISKMLIEFALTGSFSDRFGELNDDVANLGNQYCVALAPVSKPGRIADIRGASELMYLPGVIDYLPMKKVGDVVDGAGTSAQKASEYIIVADTAQQCRDTALKAMSIYHILGDDGREMIPCNLDVSRLSWGHWEG